MGCVVDSGASCHMMGSHDIFTNMTNGQRDIHVDLSDSIRYSVKVIGNI